MHLTPIHASLRHKRLFSPSLCCCPAVGLRCCTLTLRPEGTWGQVCLSLQQAHTLEPLAEPRLTDKLISEHPAARRDAFNQRPPGQPPSLQSEFLLWSAPSGKAGERKPADLSSAVCQGPALCLPRRLASVETTRLCIPAPLVASHSAWFLPSHFILTVTGL